MSNNKEQLPRLYMYLKDLRQAREFATHIIEEGFHEKGKTDRRRLVHLAFATSLIVSYSRPFTWSNNLEGRRESSLQDYAQGEWTEDELDLHRRVLDMRNQAYAHSDANSNYFDLDYDHYSIMKVVEVPNKADTELLGAMLIKCIRRVQREIKIRKTVT